MERRRQAVLALSAFCVLFLVTGVTANFIEAALAGHGTGFGDGRQLTDGIIWPHGTGFLGDTLLLVLTVLLDAAVIGAWWWIASRLGDPRGAEVDAGAGARVDGGEAGWYLISMPRLTRALCGVAMTCVVALGCSGAVLLPWILIRFGWTS